MIEVGLQRQVSLRLRLVPEWVVAGEVEYRDGWNEALLRKSRDSLWQPWRSCSKRKVDACRKNEEEEFEGEGDGF